MYLYFCDGKSLKFVKKCEYNIYFINISIFLYRKIRLIINFENINIKLKYNDNNRVITLNFLNEKPIHQRPTN